MKESRKILIAVDDSDASTRAVRYVANIVGGRKNFTVRLFHVLDPLPPELRVFGASPVLERERELEAKLEEKRERWLHGAKEEARPVVERALSILRKALVPVASHQIRNTG
jgi:nucleotide-binding universal stress UspA family protein